MCVREEVIPLTDERCTVLQLVLSTLVHGVMLRLPAAWLNGLLLL